MIVSLSEGLGLLAWQNLEFVDDRLAERGHGSIRR